MYQEISQLLMYGDLDEDSILAQMGEVFGKYETGEYNKNRTCPRYQYAGKTDFKSGNRLWI